MTARIPRHSVYLTALTDDEGDPARAVQYAVRAPDGDLRVFGDQEWVADGRATEDGGGTVVHRDVTITYGPWSDETTPAPQPVPDDLRDALTEALVALCGPSIGRLYREDRKEWDHYLTEWPHAPGFLGGVVVPQAVTNIVDAVLPVVEAREVERDALKAEVAELRAELGRFTGAYGTWHIFTGRRADGTEGPTIAGSTPLTEKLAHVRSIRAVRPELVTWRMERIEQWSRRVPEPMPADVLTEWVGYTPEGARIVCAELGIVGREAGLDAQD